MPMFAHHASTRTHAQTYIHTVTRTHTQVGRWSRRLEAAVGTLSDDAGVTVVVASGNGRGDACGMSPANTPQAITVAGLGRGPDEPAAPAGFVTSAAEILAQAERRQPLEPVYSFSNTGPCVDIFAPGTDVLGACGSSSASFRPGFRSVAGGGCKFFAGCSG